MDPIPFEQAWQRTAFSGAVTTAIGSIPVWITMTVPSSVAEASAIPERATRGGVGGDGLLTLLLAVLVVGLLVRSSRREESSPSRTTGVITILVGALSAVTAAVAYQDASNLRPTVVALEDAGIVASGSTDAVVVDVSVALWVVVVGGLIVVAAGVMCLLRVGTGSQDGSAGDPADGS